MGWPSIAVCMLAVVVTVSAQCSSPTFTAFPNEHIRGGNLDSSIGDLAACKDSCVADNSCFAVDVIEVNPFRCYKLSDPTLSRETQNGVTHYRMKQICEISSTSKYLVIIDPPLSLSVCMCVCVYVCVCVCVCVC
ncbi:hypothetical protein LSH36_214g05066 [Paralvinella palmiformis]|uniref:Apple domain-containing protein n=1 Tax=Paralvinella palmiformis TaxID=53620 RepID=A0AAD9JQR4_9ANNE|nr:hypothetical protein LSH36_214g05066 [Paralvinella palmiformis]